MPVRRILVAVDGSEPAVRTLALAAGLETGAEAGGPELLLAAERQGAERDLAQRAEQLRTDGLKVHILIRVGPPLHVFRGPLLVVPHSLYPRAL
jgi:nucleotide-binding universal stress UspA family protein